MQAKSRWTLLFIWLLGGSTFLQSGYSQSPAPSNHQNAMARDANGIRLLTESLLVMGGRSRWENIHSFSSSGVETRLDGTSKKINLADDWTKQLVMMREYVEPTGTVHKYIQSHGKVYVDDGKQLHATRNQTQNAVSALIGHLPAVAILTALDDPTYQISISHDIQQIDDSSCILIVPPGPQPLRVRLCLSNTTQLPTAAFVDLRNLLNPSSHLVETIRYTDFTDHNGLLTPFHASVRAPNGMTRVVTLSSIEKNASISFTGLSGAIQ